MNALHQHIGGDEYFAIRIMEYGTIVAYAISGRFVLWFNIFCQSVDETELS
jgi:hypothetical protein